MTEWLLLIVLLTGQRYVTVDSLSVSRLPTLDACEQAGARFKAESKKRAAFTCFEVNKLHRK